MAALSGHRMTPVSVYDDLASRHRNRYWASPGALVCATRISRSSCAKSAHDAMEVVVRHRVLRETSDNDYLGKSGTGAQSALECDQEREATSRNLYSCRRVRTAAEGENGGETCINEARRPDGRHQRQRCATQARPDPSGR